MELEEEQNCYPGCIPEFGAIFMSNSETKVECFRRKLFGLPSWQGPFVKQIKAGMVLFLFEFNRRKMHGVYQASTDGAMNIVPHAYSSSGLLFPAQVKFTHLWHCSPLSEDEFREAIKENYYTAKKFNFGLSEDQVHKLLYLFSFKKLKPQKDITKYKDARYSVDKFRGAADDRRSIASSQGEEADSSHVSTDHFGALLGNDGRTIDDGRFAKRARSGVVGAAISTLYPGQFEAGPTFCRSMKPQGVNLSCPISTEDALMVSCHPYDPDAPGIEPRHLSSYEHKHLSSYEHTSNPVQHFASPHNSNAESLLPSSENQFSFPYPEPRGEHKHLSSYEHTSNPVQHFASPHNGNAESLLPSSENQFSFPYPEPRGAKNADFSSVLGYGAPMASPDHYGNSQRTRMPFSETSYFENMVANPSGNDGYRYFSLPRPSPYPFSDSGNSDGTSRGASYSFSPSQYPSIVFDYVSREPSQDNDQKNPVKFNYIDHHDNSSLNPDDVCENYEGMYSDSKKNPKSVFSRLALPPEDHIREYDTLIGVGEDMMDTSVDEVMTMLHQSDYQSLQMRKKKQLFKVDTTDFRKRQKTSYSRLLKDRFKNIPDEVIMNNIPASEKNSESAEKTPFMDFKRRSELRKSDDTDSKIGGWSAKTDGSAGGLDKRRKLIRPNFSKNELIDTVRVGTLEKVELQVLSHISQADNNIEAERVSTCKQESVETFGTTFSNPIDTVRVGTLEKVELQVLSHISQADNNIEAERVSTCKQESVETFGTTFSNPIEVGKELSQSVDIGTIPFSISEGQTNKDSVVDGLLQDLNSSTHSVQQEPSLEACEGSHNGIASGEIECSRNMQESDPNVVLDGEIAVDKMNDSSHQTHELERASEEVIASECKVFKADVQQNDDDDDGEGSNNGIASGEIECSRNMQESDPNVVLDGEIAVDKMNDSSHQTHELERASEEVIASECKVFKADVQQNDDDENAVISSSCEIISGQSQTISSN